MSGGFIGLNKKQSNNFIDGVGGRSTRPIGETSIFYNEALDGVPRNEDLFAVRVLGRTAQVEGLKDIIKSQIAGTDFSVVPDVPEDEDREPTDAEIQAAKNIEEFFKGNFNSNPTTIDDLHGLLLDDILDLNSGVLELVPDSNGYLKSIIPRDGLTFTINQKQNGLLPEPDSGEPAYYQFSISAHAKQFLTTNRRGIDLRDLQDVFYDTPFNKIFNREQKEFSRDQIVWFSEPQNMKNYTPYGRGRTQKVKNLAENMINGDIHRNRFFHDNEYHKGFLNVSGEISQQDKDKIEAKFHESAGNEHEMKVIGAEGADYVEIDPDPEKMQFLESQKWYTKEVLRAYGLNDVAKGMLENANKGISENAKEQIFRRVSSPLITMFENRWNDQVLPFMEEYQQVNGNVKFQYRPENRFLEKMENDIIDQELQSGTMTVNEARERKGEQTFGEVGDMPNTVFQELARNNPTWVAEQITGIEDIPEGDNNNQNPFGNLNIGLNSTDDDDTKRSGGDSTGKSGQGKDEDGSGRTANNIEISSYREAFKHRDELLQHTKDALRNQRGFDDVKGIVNHKNEMKKDVAQVFESIDLEERLRQNFPESEQDSHVLVDADKIVEDIDIRNRLGSVIESNNLGALELSAEHHEKEIEKRTEEKLTIPSETKIEISFDVMNTFTADIIRSEALDAATNIEATIKDRLRNQILKGAENGEGIPQITDRVKSTVSDISDSNAELVARTETLSSSRKGSQALAESTDLIEGKEWLATNDSRTREWHKVMDGQIVNKNEPFTVPQTGDSEQPSNYPRTARVVGEDQRFNCRCSQAPVLAEDMPDNVQDLRNVDGVNIDLGITERQFEVWKQHNNGEDSFQKFWSKANKEMSKTEIAESFEMSKTTVYKWN